MADIRFDAVDAEAYGGGAFEVEVAEVTYLHLNVLVQPVVGGGRREQVCQHQFVVRRLAGGDFHAVEVNGILLPRHGGFEDDGSPWLSGQSRKVEFVTLPSLFAVTAEVGRTYPYGVGTFDDVSHLQGIACGVVGGMEK